MAAGLRIVGLAIAACVLYGLIHDQITVRICLEYFSVYHPQIIASTNPTVLALAWGVVATWWVGVLLGVPLALAARVGPWPRRDWRALVRPLLLTLAAVGLCAALVGLSTWRAGLHGSLGWPSQFGIPPTSPDRRTALLVAWHIHGTSYFVGFVAGMVLAAAVFIGRVLQAQDPAASARTSAS